MVSLAVLVLFFIVSSRKDAASWKFRCFDLLLLFVGLHWGFSCLSDLSHTSWPLVAYPHTITQATYLAYQTRPAFCWGFTDEI